MNGLMMDFQLTIPHLLQRAETFFGDKEIVTRLPDRSFHRYTYADMTRRAKQLAVALKASASSRATASRRSAGTTTSTWRRTSGSRAAATCSTR